MIKKLESGVCLREGLGTGHVKRPVGDFMEFILSLVRTFKGIEWADQAIVRPFRNNSNFLPFRGGLSPVSKERVQVLEKVT